MTGGGLNTKKCSNFNHVFYSYQEELLVEYDVPRSTPYLSHFFEGVPLAVIELTESFLGNT